MLASIVLVHIHVLKQCKYRGVLNDTKACVALADAPCAVIKFY